MDGVLFHDLSDGRCLLIQQLRSSLKISVPVARHCCQRRIGRVFETGCLVILNSGQVSKSSNVLQVSIGQAMKDLGGLRKKRNRN